MELKHYVVEATNEYVVAAASEMEAEEIVSELMNNIEICTGTMEYSQSIEEYPSNFRGFTTRLQGD